MSAFVQVDRITRITSSDGKVKWEVDHKNIVEVEDKSFVKLARSTYGFARLVFHRCDQVPNPLPKGYSLTASLGYEELLKLRNQMHAIEFIESAREGVPGLFKDSAVMQPKRLSRSNIRDLRTRPRSTTRTRIGTRTRTKTMTRARTRNRTMTGPRP